MKPRGKQAIVSPEELEKIIEMKKTISARQVSKILQRSIGVIVYADKPKPLPKETPVIEGMFNWNDYKDIFQII
jgi:hypothetical protein